MTSAHRLISIKGFALGLVLKPRHKVNSEMAYQVCKAISQLQKGKQKGFLVVVQEEGNFCKGTLLYLFEV